MAEVSCDRFRQLSAEYALGILEGRERAEAVAHVEGCPECQHELAAMGDVADMLSALTPSAEPPAGLETKVLRQVSSRRLRARRRLIVRLVAAAAVAALFGVGGWDIGHRTAPAPSASAAGSIVSAPLVASNHRVGDVIAAGGDLPWMAMAVETTLGDGTVRCQLTQRHGQTVTLGDFTLSDGYGYWSAPLPVPVAQVSGARLIDSDGQTVATAVFPSS